MTETITVSGEVLDAPADEPLGTTLELHAQLYMDARRRVGQGTLDAANAVASARTAARHGQWGPWLKRTGLSESGAKRLLDVHEEAQRNSLYADRVRSGFLTASVAGELAQGERALLEYFLTQEQPPTVAEVRAEKRALAFPPTSAEMLPEPAPPARSTLAALSPESLTARGIALDVDRVLIPPDWDAWRAQALALPGGRLTLSNTGGVELWVGGSKAQVAYLGTGNAPAAWARITGAIERHAARYPTHPDAVPPPPPPSEAERIRAELDALAARQVAGMFDAADQAALDDLDHSLDAAVADLDDTTYEALARDLTTLQEWSPAEPEPTGDAPLAESELADLSRLGGWEILTSKESAAGLQITMRCMHGEDGPSMAKQTRGPGGWRMELSDLRQQEAIKERNRELAKRNIAAHTPADRIPQDWDDWRSRALRLPQGELGMAHNGAISLLVAGRIDAGVREARNRWPLVCRRIVELEETYSPTPAPAPCPIAVEALVAAQRRATAAGYALGWLQERGEFALRNMAVGGLSVTYAADDWGSVMARLAELERPSAPPDVAAALATARAGMAQAAAQQEATALPPTGAGGELYQRAERGPLAEILRLSPPALRLLSLTHFGGEVGDTEEDIREWLWESLTSDTQALDEGALAWALGEAPAERRAA